MDFAIRFPRVFPQGRLIGRNFTRFHLRGSRAGLLLRQRSLSTQRPLDNLPAGSPYPPINVENVLAKVSPPQVPVTERPLRTLQSLPVSCPGCGALTQDVDQGTAGYYTRSRKAVKNYLKELRQLDHAADTDDTHVEESVTVPQTSDVDCPSPEEATAQADPPASPVLPICDRCHDLIHESKGVPIAHPSIENIADSIAESPFSRNHVYHVIDAADFPMSLIPLIHKHLDTARPRTQNRRSPHLRHSTKPGLSFIITRSDLLGPSKEMVDRMMPKISTILRTALGYWGEKLRLGNVHLVSSKRGWWTPGLKDNIWERGGGNWLVGKFNVGKSNLFEVIFPKGSGHRAISYADLEEEQRQLSIDGPRHVDILPEDSLLPPAQPELRFPSMPLVSNLPGTTAAPIRLPFGNHRGELIDLPGLERSGLDYFVDKAHKSDLVMTSRPNVKVFKVKVGQSLLLGGGLVRITPMLDENDPSTILLAYPFVPLKAHVTSTDKAIGTQEQRRESGIETILAEDVGTSMSSAGIFNLETDVTRSRAGSMVRAGVDPSKLPFEVFATDILIEGVGWIELVCQVRKSRRRSSLTSQSQPLINYEAGSIVREGSQDLLTTATTFQPFGGVDFHESNFSAKDPSSNYFPKVEIFTPNGKSVGQRPCLGIWQLWNQGLRRTHERSARPRKPMSGAKKRDKLAKRAALAVQTRS
ncbi:uncharacterized protein A1O9_08882 [Exophiala aquamarina CBS 119918]|uniref:G domain-containing protein n=1 Tax=Exophiala aquamarina CBS 119918 TaxID=1182545 RepID=A0A072P7H6_9EURO|nr:uncharacterized protein A1O9_08882 [Exophiala aquamarina CBS 119918]KEF55228.1 hypothetical protein A1O9_08882 [Exophiala aquamarina CBS 119918]